MEDGFFSALDNIITVASYDAAVTVPIKTKTKTTTTKNPMLKALLL